ncbi:MAG: cysteine-rich CWC family protein [Bacteroidota bacterium]
MVVSFQWMTELNNSICPQCGKEFACGAKAGSETCWCFSLPRVVSPHEGTKCLCSACLAKKISELDRRSEPSFTK